MMQNGAEQVDIKLGIVADYPVGWNFEKVLRDLIQNFYDEIGAENFHKEFYYHYYKSKEEDSFILEMSMRGHPFSYELLSYIGASSKRDGNVHIGRYGEGFKLAACCITQMHGLKLCMHSMDWNITPAFYTESVGNKEIRMLGYKLEKAVNDGVTMLSIKGISIFQLESIQNALKDFFYPENKLFGDKIGSGKGYDVYYRSNVPIPCSDHDPCLRGILYINNLARGRLPMPIIVNYKNPDFVDKRNRPTLDQFHTISALYSCMNQWDPESSAIVLRLMKSLWNDMPKPTDNIDTTYYLICQLVRNIVKDEKISNTFRDEMDICCFFEKKSGDRLRNSYIDQARRMWEVNGKKKAVNPIFRLMGAENAVEHYIGRIEDRYREPTPVEQKRYQIITKCIADVVRGLDESDIPKLLVDTSGSEKLIPLQFAEKIYDSKRAAKKYRIRKLAVQEAYFDKEVYNDTFLKLAEAMLQIYGTPRSAAYNSVFTLLGTDILMGNEKIEYARIRWQEVG